MSPDTSAIQPDVLPRDEAGLRAAEKRAGVAGFIRSAHTRSMAETEREVINRGGVAR
jgi:hypothetical protein